VVSVRVATDTERILVFGWPMSRQPGLGEVVKVGDEVVETF
jgi:hypothetical protein